MRLSKEQEKQMSVERRNQQKDKQEQQEITFKEYKNASLSKIKCSTYSFTKYKFK